MLLNLFFLDVEIIRPVRMRDKELRRTVKFLIGISSRISSDRLGWGFGSGCFGFRGDLGKEVE